MRYIQDLSKGRNIVQQRFKTDVNINTIVERAKVQGLPPRPNNGFFGDFTNIDFEGMQNKVCQAQEGFNLLNSKIRARFNNNPAQLIAFVSDENNKAEAIKLGLIPEPAPVVPVSPLDVTGTTDTNQVAVTK